jgi:hypothetical protein
MYACDRYVYVVQKFMEEFDFHTWTEKDHHFLVFIFSKKREQKEESLFCWTHDITLQQKQHKRRVGKKMQRRTRTQAYISWK